MAKPPNVTATKVLDDRVIEVRATGRHEYVVYFTHRGLISGGYQFKPAPERYLNVEELPSTVVEAAERAYRRC